MARARVLAKKGGGQDGGGAREEGGAAGGAEQAAGGAAAEGGADIGALAVLQQDGTDEQHCEQAVDDDQDELHGGVPGQPGAPGAKAAHSLAKAAPSSEAPPTRAPSTLGMAAKEGALSTLVEPP